MNESVHSSIDTYKLKYLGYIHPSPRSYFRLSPFFPPSLSISPSISFHSSFRLSTHPFFRLSISPSPFSIPASVSAFILLSLGLSFHFIFNLISYLLIGKLITLIIHVAPFPL